MNELRDHRLILEFTPKMGGVFSTSDLRVLMGQDNQVMLNRRIRKLEEERIITRFARGYYVTETCSLEILSAKICPESYLSLGTVLARDLLIGSIPQKTIYAVKPGKSREFRGERGTLIFKGISSDLVFGYRLEGSIRYACPEKAFIDVLYFHQKGQRFSFDIYSDIDISRLNLALVEEYLSRYSNPRFISFVRGVLRGGNT